MGVSRERVEAQGKGNCGELSAGSGERGVGRGR